MLPVVDILDIVSRVQDYSIHLALDRGEITATPSLRSEIVDMNTGIVDVVCSLHGCAMRGGHDDESLATHIEMLRPHIDCFQSGDHNRRRSRCQLRGPLVPSECLDVSTLVETVDGRRCTSDVVVRIFTGLHENKSSIGYRRVCQV